MKIGGFQPTSLLDYPDKISAIIWTVGCNFRCPFCYNRDIVLGKSGIVPEKDILDFLKKRKGLLEALAVTGGEPLMQKNLAEFLEKVKELGYLIKVDTNGMFPEKLKKLIDKKLVDYVAMDVKAPKKKYDKLSGIKTDTKKIQKSIKILKESEIDYEFRTTFVPDFLKKEDIIEIGKWLKGSKQFYLQQFKNDTDLISSNLKKIMPYSKKELNDTLEEIKPYFENCETRGI
jgi:pyruvate formate lyase activating enzyme